MAIGQRSWRLCAPTISHTFYQFPPRLFNTIANGILLHIVQIAHQTTDSNHWMGSFPPRRAFYGMGNSSNFLRLMLLWITIIFWRKVQPATAISSVSGQVKWNAEDFKSEKPNLSDLSCNTIELTVHKNHSKFPGRNLNRAINWNLFSCEFNTTWLGTKNTLIYYSF
jgi:hypothetical protein